MKKIETKHFINKTLQEAATGNYKSEDREIEMVIPKMNFMIVGTMSDENMQEIISKLTSVGFEIQTMSKLPEKENKEKNNGGCGCNH